MKHRTRWIALAVGAVVVVLAVVLAIQIGEDPGYEGGVAVGKRAPLIDLVNLEGDPITTADLDGKVVVVNFWNDWCIPCRLEHPALAEFYERHRDDPNFEMVGIVRDQDDASAIRRYVEDEGVEWVVALDPDGKAALDFGTFGQPETYVIDVGGMITKSFFGPASVADLEAMISPDTQEGQ